MRRCRGLGELVSAFMVIALSTAASLLVLKAGYMGIGAVGRMRTLYEKEPCIPLRVIVMKLANGSYVLAVFNPSSHPRSVEVYVDGQLIEAPSIPPSSLYDKVLERRPLQIKVVEEGRIYEP